MIPATSSATTTFERMLDTNMMSQLVHDPDGVVSRRLRRLRDDTVCTSIIIASEMRFGVAKLGSPRFARQVEAVLSAIAILPFQSPADQVYGNIRAHLARLGRPIGPNDLLIAAHALTLGTILVTHNTSEFSRVPGLVIEDWLE